MAQPRRGRPPNPVDPDASHAARLGAELRARRTAHGERADAAGAVRPGRRLRAAVHLRGRAGQDRRHVRVHRGGGPRTGRARRARGAAAPRPCASTTARAASAPPHAAQRAASRRYAVRPTATRKKTVQPTSRRGLIGAGAAAAVGLSTAAAPAAARKIDPELPDHWARLLNLLGRHDAMFGPRDVLEFVEHDLGRIVEHREVARGELGAKLMRIEARWAGLAAWLSEDAGRTRSRDAYADRTLRLASEAGYGDMVAYLRTLQSRFALQERDAPRAIAFAEAGLRVPGTSQQTRALCARQAALGHALGRDATACERRMHEAHALLDADSSRRRGRARRSRGGTCAPPRRSVGCGCSRARPSRGRPTAPARNASSGGSAERSAPKPERRHRAATRRCRIRTEPCA
jgi:hypothetical protein